MGGLCCPSKEAEVARGLVPHGVARDIKTVIVNPANPVTGLTSEQLRAIHQGRITSWAELGWQERPIAVIYRVHCLDRREPVRTYLDIDRRLQNLAPKAIKVRTDKELVDYVAQFPTAIGVTSRVFAGEAPVKMLKLDGAPPTAAAVVAGRYPFTATLYIVTKGPPDPETRRFLQFVTSPAGEAIVRRRLAPP